MGKHLQSIREIHLVVCSSSFRAVTCYVSLLLLMLWVGCRRVFVPQLRDSRSSLKTRGIGIVSYRGGIKPQRLFNNLARSLVDTASSPSCVRARENKSSCLVVWSWECPRMTRGKVGNREAGQARRASWRASTTMESWGSLRHEKWACAGLGAVVVAPFGFWGGEGGTCGDDGKERAAGCATPAAFACLVDGAWQPGGDDVVGLGGWRCRQQDADLVEDRGGRSSTR